MKWANGRRTIRIEKAWFCLIREGQKVRISLQEAPGGQDIWSILWVTQPAQLPDLNINAWGGGVPE